MATNRYSKWKDELAIVLGAIQSEREAQLSSLGLRKPDMELDAMSLTVEAGELLKVIMESRLADRSVMDEKSLLLHHAKKIATRAAFLMQLIKNGEA